MHSRIGFSGRLLGSCGRSSLCGAEAPGVVAVVASLQLVEPLGLPDLAHAAIGRRQRKSHAGSMKSSSLVRSISVAEGRRALQPFRSRCATSCCTRDPASARRIVLHQPTQCRRGERMLRKAIDQGLKRISRRRPAAATIILIGQLIEDLAGALGVEVAGSIRRFAPRIARTIGRCGPSAAESPARGGAFSRCVAAGRAARRAEGQLRRAGPPGVKPSPPSRSCRSAAASPGPSLRTRKASVGGGSEKPSCNSRAARRRPRTAIAPIRA